jgi:hypothetical protein
MTTSTWLPPLLVAALGIAGTLAAAVFTQRNASRRDDITWAREREREQERWAREDAARTFTDRRDAYIQFSDALRGMTGLIYNFGTGRIVQPDDANDGELPADFGLATFRKLQHLRLYATPQAGRRADVAFMVAWRWGTGRGTPRMTSSSTRIRTVSMKRTNCCAMQSGPTSASLAGQRPGSGALWTRQPARYWTSNSWSERCGALAAVRLPPRGTRPSPARLVELSAGVRSGPPLAELWHVQDLRGITRSCWASSLIQVPGSENRAQDCRVRAGFRQQWSRAQLRFDHAITENAQEAAHFSPAGQLAGIFLGWVQ